MASRRSAMSCKRVDSLAFRPVLPIRAIMLSHAVTLTSGAYCIGFRERGRMIFHALGQFPRMDEGIGGIPDVLMTTATAIHDDKAAVALPAVHRSGADAQAGRNGGDAIVASHVRERRAESDAKSRTWWNRRPFRVALRDPTG